MADGTIIIDTELDQSGFEKGLGKLGSLAGTGLKATTAAITAVSTALSACAVYCAKVGSEMETSMAKVSTIADTSAVSLGELQAGLQQISSSVGLSAASLSEAMYQALSASVATGDALQFVELSSKLAIGGFTDTETAVDALSSVVNAYGSELLSAEDAAKILMQTQNKGKTTVGELAASLSQCIPTAAAFNVSFEQVGASLATMTAQGTKTAQATTMLNSLCAELGKSGTKAAQSLEKAAVGTQYAGMSFSEMMASGASLGDVLMLISDNASKSGLSMVDMFSSIEAGKAAMQLVNAEGEMFRSSLAAMSTEANVVDDAFQKMTDTFEAQTNILRVSAENLGIAVYEKLQEPLKDLAKKGTEYIGQLTDAFSSGGFEGLVGEMGNVLADVLTEVVEFAPQMVTAAVSVIESFIEGLSSAVPEIGTAVAEVGTTLVEGILTIVHELLTLGIELIISLVEGVAQAAPQLIEAFVQAIGSIISTLIEHTPELLQAGMDLLQSLATGVLSALPTIGETAPALIETLCNNLSSQLPQLLEAAAGIIMELGSGLISYAPQLITAVVGIIQNIAQFIIQNLPTIQMAAMQIIFQLANTLVDSIPELLASVVEIMEGILGFVVDNLPFIVQSAVEIITTLCEKLVALIPELIPVWTQVIMSIFNFVVQNLPTIVQAAIQIMVTLVNGIIAQIPTLVPAVVQLISQIFQAIVANLPTIISGAVQIVTTLAMGLIQAIPHLIAAVPKLVVSIMEGFLKTDWASVGMNIIKGIGAGIAAAASGLVQIAVNAAKSAINAVKSWLGINSPSKRAKREIGKWILPGIGEGVDETAPDLNEKMEDTAEGMTEAFSKKTDDIDTDDLMKKLKDSREPEKPKVNVVEKSIGDIPTAFREFEPTPPVDVSALVAKMRAGVEMEVGRISADVQVRSKISSSQLESETREEIDYERLGAAVASGLIQANVKVECDDRDFGRLIADILPL